MAHKKAAIKWQKKSLKAYARHSELRRKVKNIRKDALRAIASKSKEEAFKLYLQLQKAVDKASKAGGFMKKNTAARYKSAIMKRISALGK